MEVKKFFKKAIAVVIIIYIVDQLAGSLLRYIYTKQGSGEYKEATYVMDSVRTEGIIFGSSRASHHYVPKVLEDSLKLSFYNAGRDGCGIIYNYAALKSVIARYNPRLIIFDITPEDLFYVKSDYDRLALLLPYYKTHPDLRQIIQMRSPFEKFKLISATYPFNSQTVSLLKGLFNLSINNITGHNNGYLPLDDRMKATKVANNNLILPPNTFDSYKINILNDIANLCREKSIQLYFIYSPIFSNATIQNAKEKIEQTALKNQIKFFDFSSDTSFDNHPEYFHDNGHLNADGATFFSKILSSKLKIGK